MGFGKKLGRLAVLLIAFVLLAQWGIVRPLTPAYASDEYDTLRTKIYDMTTGGSTYDPSDPDIAVKIASITATAQGFWDTLNKSAGRTYLWSDLASTTKSSDVSGSYSRLEQMTLAYVTRGSSLENNAALRTDIISAMDWMYTNRYNTSVPKRGYDNWYDWQIGSPLNINDIITWLYSSLTATQINNWEAVIDYQALQWGDGLVGANRVWACNIKVTSGILTKDSAKIIEGRDQLSPVFEYVTSGQGMYRDGSFLQHTALIPYNGGYAVSLIDNLTKVMYVLTGSPWDITDPAVTNIYQWIYDAFEPLFINDRMAEMVRGRDISREASDDAGFTSLGALGSAVIRMANSAPSSADRAAYKSMIKKWMQAATSPTKYSDFKSIGLIVQAKSIVNDPSVTPRADLVLNKQFPNMARTIHIRPGFAFGISMSSDKVGNYESVNTENLRGWHTGDGMTYLYNSDSTQYMNSFWPTVNSYRMPGTTVNQNTTASPNAKTPNNWVGGTSIDGLYGTTGMQYTADGYTLTAKKSWFMFDNEIVNLGAGISSTDNKVVETIVENRKLNSGGNNALTVNGTAKPTSIGWSETMSGVNRIHLAGNVAGADIGYFFPNGATVKGLRESRTDQWSSIDHYYTTPEYYTNRTNNFMNLWLDHGTNPTGSQYAYVLLPGMSSSQLDAYAASPDISIIENSADAQAVKDNTLGVEGINFWNDKVKKVDAITSDKKASVMTKTTANDFEISVADPTMANGGFIEIQADVAATALVSADPGIIVKQLSPTIQLAVNVSHAGGKSFQAKFRTTGATVPLPVPLPPGSTNLALNKTVSASSSMGSSDYAMAKLTDGQQSSVVGSDGWSSNGSLGSNHTEWVTVDLGATHKIDRVDLYPKNDYSAGYGFPVDFSIQVSSDNVNWTTEVTQTDYPLPDDGQVRSFGFVPINARYVKVNTTKIRPLLYDQNNYRVQLAEIEVYESMNLANGKTVTASSSVENTSFGTVKAVDDIEYSASGSMGWSSNDDRSVNHTEWMMVDLGGAHDVGRVDLYPRSDGVNAGYGFPIDFTIQTSPDNVNWTTVSTQTGYQFPDAVRQSFTFPSVNARYIKVNGTNLRQNPNDANLYRMQFAEVEVLPANVARNKPVTASSTYENANWGKANAVDGKTSALTGAMGWTSNNSLSADHTEWVTVDLGSAQPISKIDLYPRNDGDSRGYGMPIDFTIQVSTDNVNWTTVVTRTGYPIVAGSGQGFSFTTATARYVRVNGTHLRANPYDNGNYRMQFAEIEVYR